MSYTKPKKKTNPAIWQRAFPDQAKALRPERTAAGGVKSRSGSEKVRMEIYNAIRTVFFDVVGRRCRRCGTIFPTEVHHVQGREGLNLFDVRHFMPVCSICHIWIHDHPAASAAKGWLAYSARKTPRPACAEPVLKNS